MPSSWLTKTLNLVAQANAEPIGRARQYCRPHEVRWTVWVRELDSEAGARSAVRVRGMETPDPAETSDVTTRRGTQIPIIGFGTWQIQGDAAREAASAALEVGYRHIDTATVYGNERQIGQALSDSKIAREELFVTTKLPGNATNVRATIEQSLSDLGIDYVDLWLIHWPPARSYVRRANSSLALYEAMLTLRDEGLARAIGVSNYSAEEIDALTKATADAPEVNQIPWSPNLHDESLQRDLDQRDVRLEGYSPFKTSRLDDPRLGEIASSVGVSAAQVVLRWHVQHGIIVIPKSVHRARIRENLDIFSFSLSAEAMRTLDGFASVRR
jgi:2,5-diketo-D-gluconate reductase A